MTIVPLSILDLSPIDSGQSSTDALQNTIKLAIQAEQLGYSRFWLGEHHNTSIMVSPSPEIMVGQVARATQQIRVGAGGIMLPHYAPLKIAETFRVLEALFPGRIDLGIGRAPGTDPITTQAMSRSTPQPSPEDFPDRLAELTWFTSGRFPAHHPFRSVQATPMDIPLPPIWILGSSAYGAQIAAKNGYGFVFGHHLNAQGAQESIRLYQEHFQPSASLQQPYTIVSATIICAETEAELEQIRHPMMLSWIRLYSHRQGPIPNPAIIDNYIYSPLEKSRAQIVQDLGIIGTPTQVKEQLDQLIAKTRADELMLSTFVFGHEKRLHTYKLLADLFHLQPLEAI